MSELNLPTKLIRLTKATLTIVMCCIKIQNDCSESFETRQGLRQRDVLSTLFNVVLEVIVRQANIETTGKFIIHKTLIRPILLYGSETWVLTKREENQLLVFERKVLRTICGPKIENGVYRRRYNHELDKEFNSPNGPKCHEDKQIALRWPHDQKTRIPTTIEGEIKKDISPGGDKTGMD
jgi:hypothetical protein